MASDPLSISSKPIVLAPVRRRTIEVAIGEIVIGGGCPIAIQSMTTTRTADAAATAAQIARLARAGCEIVRVTVPSTPDAEALPEIRRLLALERVRVPLVADIHFSPKIALQVVPHVEKVRINPGNFADKKTLKEGAYDAARWERDLARLHELFAPLVDRVREHGVAMRIGTNHGSLSDRILHRFGDTPLGMVESALEFVRICEDRGFRSLVISMKASNTQVMTRAYRLLAERLDAAGSSYPLHLGVTEAGGGDEGRIKSSAGIATLLAEGLGDTVRVSLTEDPVREIPVAREIVDVFSIPFERAAPERPISQVVEVRDPLDPRRRETTRVVVGVAGIGGEDPPRVELALQPGVDLEPVLFARPPVEVVETKAERFAELDAALELLERVPRERIARSLCLGGEAVTAFRADASARRRVASVVDRLSIVDDARTFDLAGAQDVARDLPLLVVARVEASLAEGGAQEIESFARSLAGRGPRLLAGLSLPRSSEWLFAQRLFAAALDRAGARVPIVLRDADDATGDPRVVVSGRFAGLLLDGIGDSIISDAGSEPRVAAALLHGILQGARRRLEKAEFIACPSCGRTLFDLEETTARIRALTEHLKLKIGVMGCVVNGPGEMADADYGYVGWGEGKVALFVGRTMVERDIPSAEAPGKLLELIKSRGDWVDPETT